MLPTCGKSGGNLFIYFSPQILKNVFNKKNHALPTADTQKNADDTCKDADAHIMHEFGLKL